MIINEPRAADTYGVDLTDRHINEFTIMPKYLKRHFLLFYVIHNLPVLSKTQIAKMLDISVLSVSTQIENLYRELAAVSPEFTRRNCPIFRVDTARTFEICNIEHFYVPEVYLRLASDSTNPYDRCLRNPIEKMIAMIEMAVGGMDGFCEKHYV